MRVLFLADGLFPFVVGGMQKHSTMLIKHLAPLVDQITVCTSGPINSPPPSDDAILAELVTTTNNISVRTCEFRDSGRLPGHYLRASRALSRAFLQLAGDLQQYDCIYAQGLTGDAFLGRHPRVMVNLHGLEMFQPAYSWKESIEKRLMRPHFRRQIRQGWKNVSLGGKLKDILLANGANESNIVTLPNGVDDFWFDSPRPAKATDRTKFLMIGRNEYRKGYHVLQAALEKIDESLEVHFVGDWPEITHTHHQLIYYGVVRNKMDLIQIVDACHVLLLPSLSEGMPTVVLEAKARGLKVIATDVGAMAELEEGLIEPGDAEALAWQMKSIPNSFKGSRLKIDFRWSQIASLTLEEFRV